MLAGLSFPLSFTGKALPYDILQDMKIAFANALSSSPEMGGYVAGMFIVVIVGLTVAILVGKDSPVVVVLLTAAGAAFVALIGYWPFWTLIFIVIVMAWGIVSKLDFFSSKA